MWRCGASPSSLRIDPLSMLSRRRPVRAEACEHRCRRRTDTALARNVDQRGVRTVSTQGGCDRWRSGRDVDRAPSREKSTPRRKSIESGSRRRLDGDAPQRHIARAASVTVSNYINAINDMRWPIARSLQTASRSANFWRSVTSADGRLPPSLANSASCEASSRPHDLASICITFVKRSREKSSPDQFKSR